MNLANCRAGAVQSRCPTVAVTRPVTGFDHAGGRMICISRRSSFTRHPDLHKNPRPAGFEIHPSTVGMVSLKTQTLAAVPGATGR
jgi:hypothetical protein